MRFHLTLPLSLSTLAASLLAALPSAQAGDFLAQAGLSSPQPLLSQTLTRLAPDADPQVLKLAASALACAEPDAERLAVIDFSRPSSEPRLWVFDLARERLLFEELVSHGRGSGDAEATRFSNTPESYQSSLGLFRTMNSYYGSNGYSLRLEGLEAGVNDQAYQRAIVIHGADYVSESFIQKTGRLGRSHGCPAVRQEVTYPLIDSIKEDHYLFAYYPDPEWLENSAFLSCDRSPTQLAMY
ncbi:MAG: murein L,D-transpeptidase catalytic domain family protein [Halomonas sp.]|uniref:Murein L,D-transpeptidase catalytic domain family protein n=1 Tax=Halomonas sulfidivorans TaxID=2733488 RepID=A0ABX7WGW5_9GAMM|nr:murein L,D-transpeptidase catalytic domain family protein [Halomonas sulfidivorans]MDX5377637.1 murein L,D-transpeptidase catalytic domain family protein [Halomonas sp.]MDX5502974.1 murein L,D-transpeptidase catalytic domain family protein [Halomonas sp.]QTP58348.1 murein L,D-transpeptidase catalytic domain family protein [Halomonas sulfidivorans]